MSAPETAAGHRHDQHFCAGCDNLARDAGATAIAEAIRRVEALDDVQASPDWYAAIGNALSILRDLRDLGGA